MPTWLLIPLVAVVLSQVAVIATSIYLHRALAHHSLKINFWLGVVFRAILWFTTGQRRQEWVAVHRKHHRYTDREGDPHSPKIHGFWNVQLFNVYYYAREARKTETIEKFAPDLPEDRLDRLLFSRGWLGVGVGVASLIAALGFWPGVAASILHAVLYVFVLAPLINALGHWTGRKDFASDFAYNWRTIAWFTGGEALHNNHHAYQKAPKFSMRRFEFDPSWPVIRALAALRLVHILGGPIRV